MTVPSANELGSSGLKEAQIILQRLVRQQVPTGNYSTTIVRGGGRPEVYLAFEKEADARKLADAMHAKVIAGNAGWATRCAFSLSASAAVAMAADLPPPKSNPRTK